MNRHTGKDVPGWDEMVKPERERSLFWHWMWQEAGKPRTGVVYNVMKRTRHQYHYVVRCCKRQKFEIQKQKITANISNSTIFWKEIRKLNPTSKTISNNIDDANGPLEISNLFYEKYRCLYNSVPTSTNELNDLHHTISNGIMSTTDVFITPTIIRQALRKLKPGKGDGDRGFKSDHLLHSTHRFHVLLCLLFNTMLVHGYTPDDLLKSSIISIPKDGTASQTTSDNYREISLFNAICKLFDNVILVLYGDELQSSDMQCGYKQGHSTTLCTLIYKEVVHHYLNSGSNVYSCLLDASKAFDRVHYGTLFRLLLTKCVPMCFMRLVLDSYIRQKACALWNNVKSRYFTMANGVKQGGVISPIFFSLYIDPLLDHLRMSGFGCHIKGVYMGALSYADDITIMCPIIGGLNEMLKICYSFEQSNSIIFNNKKTVCIKFGKEIVKNEKAVLNTHVLKWVDKVKHLGNYMNKDCNEVTDCNFKKSLFIGYVNKLRSNFGKMQLSTLISLFKSYCCFFYGSHLWKFNSSGFDKCCKSWNNCCTYFIRFAF